MTALASYLRHLIVVLLLMLVQKYKLPIDGADAAANAFALIVFGTATWAVVKYLPNLAKSIGLVCIMGASLLLLPSCATTVTTTTLPDGTTIVVTAKQADAAAINGAIAISSEILPLVIHRDK